MFTNRTLLSHFKAILISTPQIKMFCHSAGSHVNRTCTTVVPPYLGKDDNAGDVQEKIADVRFKLKIHLEDQEMTDEARWDGNSGLLVLSVTLHPDPVLRPS